MKNKNIINKVNHLENKKMEVLITARKKFIKENTNLSHCKDCKEKMYGFMYRLAIEIFINGDYEYTENTDIAICSSCYSEIKE